MVKKQNDSKNQIEELKEQIADLTNKWKRALADYQNLEKQTEAQKRDWASFASSNLVIQLLPVLENLEKSAAHLEDKGLELTVSQLKDILQKEGLEEMPIEPGKTPFDASQMECIEACQGKKNKVVKVAEKGYKLNGKIIKPVKVVVGK